MLDVAAPEDGRTPTRRLRRSFLIHFLFIMRFLIIVFPAARHRNVKPQA
jgi:hypothetical protein